MATRPGRGEKKGTRLGIREVKPTAALATPPTGRELVPRYSHKTKTFGPIEEICRKIVGGKKTFMELARLAPELEPALKRVVEEWEHFGRGLRTYRGIEHLCQSKGVDPIHFIAVVGEAAIRFRDNSQILIAAMNTPAVVDRLCKEAVKPDRPEYTRMFLQHTGFLPTPRGTEIRMNQYAAQAQVNTSVDGDLPTVEEAIFEFDEIVRKKVEPEKEPPK